MRLIDADAITNEQICQYLGSGFCDCAPDIRDLIDDQPTVDGWVSCKDHLPKGGVETIPCIVTLVENKPGWGDEYAPTRKKYSVPAEYDPVQKLWDLLGANGYSEHPPVNALLGEEDMVDEDGERIDWACYVSHWMPLPAPPSQEVR